MSEYEGYDLFNDVEDIQLKTRNRAICMWNIFQSGSKGGKVHKGTTATMFGYFTSIPSDERADVLSLLGEIYAEGGAS